MQGRSARPGGQECKCLFLLAWQLLFPIACSSPIARRHQFLRRTDSIVGVSSNDAYAQDDLVYAVLCTSNESHTQMELLVSQLDKKGYRVIQPDCSNDFAGEFVSKMTGHAYKYWGRRLVRYRDALQGLVDDALVMLLDVNDVLVMGDAHEAVQKFKSFSSPLVASCTEGMWPPPEDCPAYSKVQSKFATVSACKFPCAGALMGTSNALRELLQDLRISESTNDQCWLHEKLSSWPSQHWTLDVEGQLFIDVSRVPQGAFLPKAGRYIIDGSVTPTVIHMPGLHPPPSTLRELYGLAGATAKLGI